MTRSRIPLLQGDDVTHPPGPSAQTDIRLQVPDSPGHRIARMQRKSPDLSLVCIHSHSTQPAYAKISPRPPHPCDAPPPGSAVAVQQHAGPAQERPRYGPQGRDPARGTSPWPRGTPRPQARAPASTQPPPLHDPAGYQRHRYAARITLAAWLSPLSGTALHDRRRLQRHIGTRRGRGTPHHDRESSQQWPSRPQPTTECRIRHRSPCRAVPPVGTPSGTRRPDDHTAERVRDRETDDDRVDGCCCSSQVAPRRWRTGHGGPGQRRCPRRACPW